jgi:radical SAM superfamily enzyme YgiQ (UPF0313 family)
MKILLIQPPVRDFYRTSIRTQPIGLAYLAASLQSDGHEVEILDCQTEKKRSIPTPSELSYLQDLYPFNDRSPFRLYTGYYHFGMSWEEIRRKVEDSKADLFGISSSFTPYHQEALEIARIIKEWDRRKIVAMGGAHVSSDPESVLKSPFVDYIVLGEGEIRFPLLLKQLEKGRAKGIREIDGIGYRVDGKIHIEPLQNFIQDLDSLPHPARELLDLDRYQMKKKRSTMIITSRGCPHGCTYCSAHLVMGRYFRKRSPEGILQEMVGCQKRYGIQIFDIEDDNFTFDKEHAKRLMDHIIEACGEQVLPTVGPEPCWFRAGKLELTAMNGISFASLDEELLRLMKKAGFHTINLSFVSTNLSTKERMRRPEAITGFDKILEEAERVGLRVVAYGIFGMPGQTLEEMVDTLIYLMGKRVLIGPSVYYPTPRTPLFEKCQEEGILPPHSSQWRSSALPIETKDFNRLDIITLFRLARTINFIKGKMGGRELKEEMTLQELFQVLQDRLHTSGSMPALRKASGDGGFVPYEKDGTTTWMNLLLLFLKERSFFSLGNDSLGGSSVFKEKSSEKVLNCFFEKAWKKPILKHWLD